VGGKARRTRLSLGIVDTLQAIAKMIDARPLGCAVIGGIAVIARGVRRLTRDVDLVVEGAAIDATSLVAELATVGIVPRIADPVEFATESLVLLMRHAQSGVDVDVSLAWLPFELEAIAEATSETIADVRLPVARAEDLVIFKAVAWRLQDQQDVERLLAIHARDLDLDRVRRRVAELAQALEVDRSSALEALIGAGRPSAR
jgi:hypothetical protein